MDIKVTAAPNQMVDRYSAQPGTVCVHNGVYYLVVQAAEQSMFSSQKVCFVDLSTGYQLPNSTGIRFTVCHKATMHISVMED